MSKDESLDTKINAGGINGPGHGQVDTNSPDFLTLQSMIKEHSLRQSEAQLVENGLLSIRFKLESYRKLLSLLSCVLFIVGCTFETPANSAKTSEEVPSPFAYREIIDLGMLITEDLPERVVGKAFMQSMGFEKNNEFDVREWAFETEELGRIEGSDSYFTLFNHAGTHVDAPNHMGEEGGIDSYGLGDFIGPVKVFDVSAYGPEQPVPKEVFAGQVTAGDIVLAYIDYIPPQSDQEGPTSIHLSAEAATYLATLPVRAFGTDAAGAGTAHPAFLTRRIPIYEQLVNLDRLLGKENMMFYGVPINIQDADASFVRPVVLVY